MGNKTSKFSVEDYNSEEFNKLATNMKENQLEQFLFIIIFQF